MDKLLTAQKVAALLNLELTTVYKWTSQGKIPHVKLSARAIRFSEVAISEWLQSKTHDRTREDPCRNCGGRKRKLTGAASGDIERIISRADMY